MNFKKETVKIDSLFLDPNNPRFADISDDALNISINRFTEEEIQKEAYEKMLHPKFDIETLAKSIETVGFLPVDNIVVKNIDNGNYVVIEGNRRISAIKFIIKQYNKGQSLNTEDSITLLKEFDVLVVTGDLENIDYIGMVVQGIRNVSGIKEWDAYQKAQFVDKMINKGKDPHTISKMIGMKVRDVNRYYKTFSAMNQFKEDNDYNEAWKLSYFSHFDELIKKPALRKYFEWDADNFKFNNLEKIRRFYDWLTPDDDGNITFSDHKEVRKLSELISEPKSLNYLDDKNLQKAVNYIETKYFNKNAVTFDECMSQIHSSIDTFKNIVAEGYENDLTDEDVELLEKTFKEIGNQIIRIKKLRNNE